MNNHTIEIFKKKNAEISKALVSLKNFVVKGEELGVTIESNITQKVGNAIDLLQKNNKLKVVLVGGFSDGKTTIAAGWLEQYDNTSMKISQAESSDEIVVYDFDDKVEIVDTPGLFGYKETYGSDGRVEKYRDITRKYVSEAHLLFYVMDPANPIKDSHKNELNWLFRTLNLLPRTVFILSRFDEVADVEDVIDYEEKLEIKRKSVIERLSDYVGLNAEERDNIEIVGISANPYDMGIEHWLENYEKYQKLSHLSTLRVATERLVVKNGEYEKIIYESQKSIIADVLNKQLPMARKLAAEIGEAVSSYEYNAQIFEKKVVKISNDVVAAKDNLVKLITRKFKDLLLQADGTDIESIKNFVDTELGEKGEVLQTEIEIAFEKELNTISSNLQQIAVEFDGTVEHFDNTVGKIAQQGLNFLKKGKYVNSTNLKALRNMAVSAGKFMKLDFSKALKFKPWGFVKLAKILEKIGAVLEVVLILWNEKKRREAEEKLNEAKNEIRTALMDMREQLLSEIRADDFVTKYFPEYGTIQSSLEDARNEITMYKERQKEFNEWCAKGEAIDAEFRVYCKQ